MKKIALGTFAVLLAGAAFASDKPAASKTMTGEVLDLACYMGHLGKGEKHATCAKQCLQGGAPAGLLTADGKVYVLVNDHQAQAAYDSLKDLGGAQAKITGKLINRGGLQGFIVEKAEKAGS